MEQWSDTFRNALVALIESTLGTAPKYELRTGAAPANVAAADAGTLLCTCTGPSDWLAAPSGGTAAFVSAFSGTVGTGGVVGHYRFKTSGGTCHGQGDVSQAFGLTTTGATSANNNVLTFADTTLVTVGVAVSGIGVPDGATVLSKTSTTVTLSAVSTAGVGSSVAVYFGNTSGKLWLPNTTLTALQTVTLTRSFTAPGA